MEREKFSLRSVAGPRSAQGVGLPVAFDTGVQVRMAPHIFGANPAPLDPTLWHVVFDDFAPYVAGDYTATETGAGGSVANTDAAGGTVLLTTDTLDNDNQFVQRKYETFLFVAGKPMVFGARLKVSKTTQSDFVIGLQITDTSPLDVTDGIFFQCDDGDANLDFHVEKDDTATSAAAFAVATAAAWFTLEFAYDGGKRIYYGKDGVELGYSVITNAPDDELLTFSFGVQNGEAGAQTMEVDYIFAATYRG